MTNRAAPVCDPGATYLDAASPLLARWWPGCAFLQAACCFQGVSTSLRLLNRADAVAWPALRGITEAPFWLLGLGPLPERTPIGLYEMACDPGWQLSPRVRWQCLESVLRRAPSLLVIAHP